MPMDVQLEKNDPLILVHISEDEAQFFDIMQGGPTIDEKLGIRSYERLGEIFKIPDMKDLFIMSLMSVVDPKTKFSKEFKRLTEKFPHIDVPEYEPEPAEGTPAVEEFESRGVKTDNDVALMPLSLVDYFDSFFDEPPRNPNDGLPQYKKFWKGVRKALKKIGAAIAGTIAGGPVGGAIAVGLDSSKKFRMGARRFARWAAPIAGALIGGPIGGAWGAALGGGLGGALGGALHPNRQKRGRAALIGGITGAVGGYMGHTYGGTSNILGNLGSAGAQQAGQQGVQEVAKAGLQEAAKTGVQEAGKKAAEQGFWASLSPTTKAAIGLTTAGGVMGAIGKAKDAKALKKQYEEQRRLDEKQRKNMENYFQSHGYYDEFTIPQFKTPVPIYPDSYEDGDREQRYFARTGSLIPDYNYLREKIKSYKKPKVIDVDFEDVDDREEFAEGGFADDRADHTDEEIRHAPAYYDAQYLEGDEKGQEDNIYTDIPANSYIMDATSVSDLGDGNSDAGKEEVHEFIDLFDQFHPRHHPEEAEEIRTVPVALSAGEINIPPHVVEAIGNGDVNKGAKILDNAVKLLRKHKSTHDGELPPKAHRLVDYVMEVANA